jgi:hypothetical protein
VTQKRYRDLRGKKKNKEPLNYCLFVMRENVIKIKELGKEKG